jgi:hypothetical protein
VITFSRRRALLCALMSALKVVVLGLWPSRRMIRYHLPICLSTKTYIPQSTAGNFFPWLQPLLS